MIRAALSLALAAAAHPAAADVVLGEALRVTQGIHCAVEDTGSAPAEGTIAGSIDTYDETPEFRWLTDQVPAAIGIAFGLHIEVPAAWAGPVRYEVEHPPMGPEGVTLEGWTGSLPANEVHYVGFHFEKPYELVTGPWTMRGYSEGTLLYEARFEVVPPELLPEITGGCFGRDLLS